MVPTCVGDTTVRPAFACDRLADVLCRTATGRTAAGGSAAWEAHVVAFFDVTGIEALAAGAPGRVRLTAKRVAPVLSALRFAAQLKRTTRGSDGVSGGGHCHGRAASSAFVDRVCARCGALAKTLINAIPTTTFAAGTPVRKYVGSLLLLGASFDDAEAAACEAVLMTLAASATRLSCSSASPSDLQPALGEHDAILLGALDFIGTANDAAGHLRSTSIQEALLALLRRRDASAARQRSIRTAAMRALAHVGLPSLAALHEHAPALTSRMSPMALGRAVATPSLTYAQHIAAALELLAACRFALDAAPPSAAPPPPSSPGVQRHVDPNTAGDYSEPEGEQSAHAGSASRSDRNHSLSVARCDRIVDDLWGLLLDPMDVLPAAKPAVYEDAVMVILDALVRFEERCVFARCGPDGVDGEEPAVVFEDAAAVALQRCCLALLQPEGLLFGALSPRTSARLQQKLLNTISRLLAWDGMLVETTAPSPSTGVASSSGGGGGCSSNARLCEQQALHCTALFREIVAKAAARPGGHQATRAAVAASVSRCLDALCCASTAPGDALASLVAQELMDALVDPGVCASTEASVLLLQPLVGLVTSSTDGSAGRLQRALRSGLVARTAQLVTEQYEEAIRRIMQGHGELRATVAAWLPLLSSIADAFATGRQAAATHAGATTWTHAAAIVSGQLMKLVVRLAWPPSGITYQPQVGPSSGANPAVLAAEAIAPLLDTLGVVLVIVFAASPVAPPSPLPSSLPRSEYSAHGGSGGGDDDDTTTASQRLAECARQFRVFWTTCVWHDLLRTGTGGTPAFPSHAAALRAIAAVAPPLLRFHSADLNRATSDGAALERHAKLHVPERTRAMQAAITQHLRGSPAAALVARLRFPELTLFFALYELERARALQGRVAAAALYGDFEVKDFESRPEIRQLLEALRTDIAVPALRRFTETHNAHQVSAALGGELSQLLMSAALAIEPVRVAAASLLDAIVPRCPVLFAQPPLTSLALSLANALQSADESEIAQLCRLHHYDGVVAIPCSSSTGASERRALLDVFVVRAARWLEECRAQAPHALLESLMIFVAEQQQERVVGIEHETGSWLAMNIAMAAQGEAPTRRGVSAVAPSRPRNFSHILLARSRCIGELLAALRSRPAADVQNAVLQRLRDAVRANLAVVASAPIFSERRLKEVTAHRASHGGRRRRQRPAPCCARMPDGLTQLGSDDEGTTSTSSNSSSSSSSSIDGGRENNRDGAVAESEAVAVLHRVTDALQLAAAWLHRPRRGSLPSVDVALLQWLVLGPIHIFTPLAIHAGVEVWKWIAYTRVDLQVPLLRWVVAGWSWTVEQRVGLFDGHVPNVKRLVELGVAQRADDGMNLYAEDYSSNSPHKIIVGFLAEVFVDLRCDRALRDDVLRLLLSLVARCVHDRCDWSLKDASFSEFMRTALLLLCILRNAHSRVVHAHAHAAVRGRGGRGGAASTTLMPPAVLGSLRMGVYRLLLRWFAKPPSWYHTQNSAAASNDLHVLQELMEVLHDEQRQLAKTHQGFYDADVQQQHHPNHRSPSGGNSDGNSVRLSLRSRQQQTHLGQQPSRGGGGDGGGGGGGGGGASRSAAGRTAAVSADMVSESHKRLHNLLGLLRMLLKHEHERLTVWSAAPPHASAVGPAASQQGTSSMNGAAGVGGAPALARGPSGAAARSVVPPAVATATAADATAAAAAVPATTTMATTSEATPALWKAYVEAAAFESPDVVVRLATRFPFAPVVQLVRAVVAESPHRFAHIADAIDLYITERCIAAGTPHLHLWVDAGVTQALRLLSGHFADHPCIVAFAIRSLLAVHGEHLTFFLPQILQCLQHDKSGEIERFLFEMSTRNVMFAHQLLWILQTEANPSGDPRDDTPLSRKCDGLAARIKASFTTPERARFYRDEFGYIDSVLELSGILKPVEKTQRKEQLRQLLRDPKFVIGDPTRVIYVPTNPTARIVSLIPETANAMQSAAKCPILVQFKCVQMGDELLETFLSPLVGGGVAPRATADGGAGDSALGFEDATPPELQHAREDAIATAALRLSHSAVQQVKGCIFKMGDDCRQDQLALQVIGLLKRIFDALDLPSFLSPYRVVTTGRTSGIIECVPDSMSRDQIGRLVEGGLCEFFVQQFGHPQTLRFKRARDNFVRSMAAYSVASYILNIKDRHNGNLLVDAQGHLIHIDFGFIFDISPGGDMNFESSPFKLTQEMLQLMGGEVGRDSTGSAADLCAPDVYSAFVHNTVRCFLAAREFAGELCALVELMIDSGLPCFKPAQTIANLAFRLQRGRSEAEAAQFMRARIKDSEGNLRTWLYDQYQKKAEGIEM